VAGLSARPSEFEDSAEHAYAQVISCCAIKSGERGLMRMADLISAPILLNPLVTRLRSRRGLGGRAGRLGWRDERLT